MRSPCKQIILLFLLLIATSTVAQNAILNTAINQFKGHYNDQDNNAVYALMAPSFKKAIDQPTLSQVMQQYYTAFGKIDSLSLKQSLGLRGVYKAYFKNGIQDIAISLDSSHLFTGFRFLPTANPNVKPKMERNTTPMQFPLKGEWYVFWGGDTKAQNYHVVSQAQRRAFDLVILKKGKTYQRSGTRNEDYFAFGQPMYAVCDAEVVKVITGVPDNRPGQMNAKQALGNSVTLKTKAGEYVVYAHFELGTIVVKEGDMVKMGQYLGNCGNSGNSSEPHLHLHLQDGLNMLTSVGIKLYFDSLNVAGENKTDYSPVQGEIIAAPTN